MIRRLIILLLIVGVIFAQDNNESKIRFNPETGEILNPDSSVIISPSKPIYDPATGEILIDSLQIKNKLIIKQRPTLYDQNIINTNALNSPNSSKIPIRELLLISYNKLTKKEKNYYNQNKIRIKRNRFSSWQAYFKINIFITSIIDNEEFFKITDHHEEAAKAKHNKLLKIKNSLLGMFCFLLGGQIFNNENDPDNLERRNTSLNFIGLAISYGGAGYFYYDYIEKKYELPNYEQVLIIADQYNYRLIQKIPSIYP